jgi:hypothetical protein
VEERVEFPECAGCHKGFLTSVLFDSLAPARLTLRANLWSLYLKGPAFSIVVKSFQQVIQEEGVPLEVTGGKAVKGLTDFIKPYF